MSWLKKRAAHLQQELAVWTHDSDAEDMEKVRDMAIVLAREFAERALGAYTCSDMDQLHLPACKEAIAQADKDDV